MNLFIKQSTGMLQLGERNICFFCLESLDETILHDVFFQHTEESNVISFGNCCGNCAMTRPVELREVFKRNFDERHASDKTEENELENLIVMAANLERHLEWLRGKIDQQKEKVHANYEMHDRFHSMINEAVIHTMVSDDESEQFTECAFNHSAHRSGKKRPGYVYLLSTDEGYFKIGRSKDVPNRYNTLKIQLPFEVKLVHFFYATDYIQAEAELHEQYGEFRVNGEWFLLTMEHVEIIKANQKDEAVVN
jgi:hypothetical protein